MKTFARAAWKLIWPYWFSEDKFRARLLLFVIVSLNLGLVYITVLLNSWYGEFYNSLQQKNFEAFKSLLLQFGILAAIFIVGAVYRLYLQQMLEISWRKWLTDRFLNLWLQNRSYYLLQLKDYGTDNPDQRIAEDLRLLSRGTLSLSLGLLSSIVTLCSFLMILWNLSGPITIFSFTIPGYMVWVAVLYAIVGSGLTHLIGRRLIKLNFEQQKYEANFRFGLVRVRENSEAIALLRGENREKKTLSDQFGSIWKNWWSIMRYQKRLTWFTAAYGQIASIFPLVVAAPRYFSGAIELGALMQISSAFGRVQDALSWFIDSYQPLTEWKASLDRLIQFEAATEKATQAGRHAALERSTSEKGGVQVENLNISLPDGSALVNNLSTQISKGERVAVRGPSGSGKSTLFRVLASLWPFANGKIKLPNEEILFLPQRPYLPIGTFLELFSYPLDPEAYGSENIKDVVKVVGLEKFLPEAENVQDWSKRLSPGEQQRVSIGRALLVKPSWLFLDEATSNLDTESSQTLHRLLSDKLPGTAIVAISHGESAFTEKEVSLWG